VNVRQDIIKIIPVFWFWLIVSPLLSASN
jgi:hypothetical protein